MQVDAGTLDLQGWDVSPRDGSAAGARLSADVSPSTSVRSMTHSCDAAAAPRGPGSRITSPASARGTLRPRRRAPSRQSYIEARDSFRDLESAALSTKQEDQQQQRDLAERRTVRQGSHWNAELEQRTRATAAARQFREGSPPSGAAKMSWSEAMSRAVIDRSDTVKDAKKIFSQLDSKAARPSQSLRRSQTLPGLAMSQAAQAARQTVRARWTRLRCRDRALQPPQLVRDHAATPRRCCLFGPMFCRSRPGLRRPGGACFGMPAKLSHILFTERQCATCLA